MTQPPTQPLTYSALKRRHDAALREWRSAGADRRLWGEVVEATSADLRAHPLYRTYLKRAAAASMVRRREAKRLAKLAREALVAAAHARKREFRSGL